MKFELRPYQIDAVDSLFEYFRTNKGNPLVAMPTGTGKSIVIAKFIQEVLQKYPDQKLLVVTHVKELIQQNYNEMINLWPTCPASIYSSGLNRKQAFGKVVFCGIGSIVNKSNLFGKVNLLIIDEAHLVSPNEKTMYQRLVKELKEKNAFLKIIGLTATPYRLGHGKLTDKVFDKNGKEKPPLFTDICFDITGKSEFNQLIEDGYLTKIIPKKAKTQFDISNVKIVNGDFSANELQDLCDVDSVTRRALDEIVRLGVDRKHWLIFASGVDHSIHIKEMLENEFGISSCVVHSKLTSQERDENIKLFKTGYYRAAVNNNVLTTGFNFPAIDMIACLRPTMSYVLWIQMLGRGTRPAPNKENCLVLDFAGNTKRLGPINDPYIPSRKNKGQGCAPVKECPECGTYQHISVTVCDGLHEDGCVCGYEFPKTTKIDTEASTYELISVEEPEIIDYKIDSVTYRIHKKESRPDSLRVTYYSGLQAFSEFICFEHGGYATHKAHAWWQERTLTTVEKPTTTEQALLRVNELKVPQMIHVWVNKKYPEIVRYTFA